MNRTEYQQYLASREWALLREAVRKRASNRCERCHLNSMNAVHHLTYERKGHERLEDLMAICDPCHEFLSGKTSQDPLTDGVKVYLAGRITDDDWRCQLLQGDIGITKWASNYLQDDDPWPIAKRALIGGFDFVGPYFTDPSAGHGGAGYLASTSHSASTGFKHYHLEENRVKIRRRCIRALDTADIVFTWLPSLAPIPAGTLWELGRSAQYSIQAYAMPMTLAMWDSGIDDLWFALEGMRVFVADSVTEAWTQFIQDWPDIRHPF